MFIYAYEMYTFTLRNKPPHRLKFCGDEPVIKSVIMVFEK